MSSKSKPTSTPSLPEGKHISRRRWLQVGLLCGAAGMTAVQSGCGLTSQLLHVTGADLIKPEYEGLKNSKVAVVTITEDSRYSNDAAARLFSRYVGSVLTKNVRNFKLVREDLIEEYQDLHGYDVDPAELGKEVGADKVLLIHLTHLNLYDGQTLFRGRADVSVEVLENLSDGRGEVALTKNYEEFTFPKLAGQDVNGTTEKKFRGLYFRVLADEVCRLFYAYDGTARVALDPVIATQ